MKAVFFLVTVCLLGLSSASNSGAVDVHSILLEKTGLSQEMLNQIKTGLVSDSDVARKVSHRFFAQLANNSTIPPEEDEAIPFISLRMVDQNGNEGSIAVDTLGVVLYVEYMAEYFDFYQLLGDHINVTLGEFKGIKIDLPPSIFSVYKEDFVDVDSAYIELTDDLEIAIAVSPVGTPHEVIVQTCPIAHYFPEEMPLMAVAQILFSGAESEDPYDAYSTGSAEGDFEVNFIHLIADNIGIDAGTTNGLEAEKLQLVVSGLSVKDNVTIDDLTAILAHYREVEDDVVATVSGMKYAIQPVEHFHYVKYLHLNGIPGVDPYAQSPPGYHQTDFFDVTPLVAIDVNLTDCVDHSLCADTCHHLTTGPCQHPLREDNACYKPVRSLGGDMVCPTGTIECGPVPSDVFTHGKSLCEECVNQYACDDGCKWFFDYEPSPGEEPPVPTGCGHCEKEAYIFCESGKQPKCGDEDSGCNSVCHPLTAGPCQHPLVADDSCYEFTEGTNVCPAGTLDCSAYLVEVDSSALTEEDEQMWRADHNKISQKASEKIASLVRKAEEA